MPGIAEIALAGAPIAGGALLGLAAGNLKAPDVRGMIKADMELLEMLPPEQAHRRAELQRVIDERIDDLIVGVDKGRSLREMAMSYRGNWRDVVMFACAVLFTVIWWHVNHGRTNWLPIFVLMIVLSIVTGIYAGRGIVTALQSLRRPRKGHG